MTSMIRSTVGVTGGVDTHGQSHHAAVIDRPKLEAVQPRLEFGGLADETVLYYVGVDELRCVGIVPRLYWCIVRPVGTGTRARAVHRPLELF